MDLSDHFTKTLKQVIKIYRFFSSSSFPCCRFYPCCSKYALEALDQYGIKGLFLIGKRFLQCHPWGMTGYDPLPEKSLFSKKSEGSSKILP
jgi:hypothetical protein